MTARQDLLDAIAEHPEDDARRLVFADWLDEHGESDRAEFIRVQLQLATITKEHPGYAELAEREGELLSKHGRDWRSVLPERLRSGARFRRGITSHVTMPARAFLRHGKTVRRQRCIDSVALRRADGTIADLLASGLLEELRHLDLGGNYAIQDPEAMLLTTAPALSSLRSLGLFNVQFSAEVSRALFRSPHLSQLEEIDLRACAPGVIESFLLHFQGTRIRKLLMNGEGIGPRAMLLAQSDRWQNLEEVQLSFGRFDAAVAETLAASRHLRKLRWLDLRYCRIGDAGVEALARSAHLGSLQYLCLASTGIGADGARALARSKSLQQLQHLDVGQNEPGDAILAELAGANLPALSWLNLSRTHVGDAGLQALARGTLFRRLRTLAISSNTNVGPEGVRALAEQPKGILSELDMGWCSVGTEGAKILAGSPHLSGLKSLRLASNKIHRPGVEAIARSDHLRVLRHLDLSFNHVGEAGARALLARADQWKRLELKSAYVPKGVRTEMKARLGSRVSFK
jgi:uncharacterized protein (TIGR02996 family)